LFGSVPEWIRSEADRRTYDLYLLLDVDVPWVDDSQRYLPDRRQEFFERCRQALIERGRPYVTIGGTWPQRFQLACQAVHELLQKSDRNSTI
jgi:nicotinamide riboside kinase